MKSLNAFFRRILGLHIEVHITKKDKLEHVMPYEYSKICMNKPGVVYDFNIQSVITFKDNLKYKGDFALCVYAGFEATAPTDDCLDSENRTVFAVSYALVFVWHPKFCLERQIVVRGFNYSLSELGDMSYLTNKQLTLRKQKTAEQLRDAVINVNSKKYKDAIVEMFNIELKFTCDILIKWFDFKFKSLSISNLIHIEYNRKNPITEETKCCICSFHM